MDVGIIGIGVVGGAIKYGFEKLGHKVVCHDIALETKIEDVLATEICFVCVPTPSKDSGECDTSIVESVVDKLAELKYTGIIAIKSTVAPGTTSRLKEKTGLHICFVPEFLRERCAVTDFTEKHDVCIIGTEDTSIYSKIKEAHGRYPKEFVMLTPTEAELCKYFNNILNATLITFANSFHEVCNSFGVNYSNVKNAMVKRDHITDIYLDCNENIRGFAGQCLPKDLKAIANVCERDVLNVDFFKMLLTENAKYTATAFEGMRK